MDYDVFISHASEDKLAFVTPLAELLQNLGVKVWYDDFTLKLGDSLSRSIDRGLATSSYGIVVLSKAFLSKPWTEYELRGLVTREVEKGKVILPIWHGVSKDDVINFSPALADKVAVQTDRLSLMEVALKILEVVRPDLYPAYANQTTPASDKTEQPEYEFVVYDNGKVADGLTLHYEISSRSRPLWVREKTNEICMFYPANQEWGAVYFTVGDGTKIRHQDFSNYNSLFVELCGVTGDETIKVSIKDRTNPRDGSEPQVTVRLTAGYQEYKLALGRFRPTQLNKLFVVTNIIFEGEEAMQICVRKIKFTS